MSPNICSVSVEREPISFYLTPLPFSVWGIGGELYAGERRAPHLSRRGPPDGTGFGASNGSIRGVPQEPSTVVRLVAGGGTEGREVGRTAYLLKLSRRINDARIIRRVTDGIRET